ncbi:dTMP kinase [Galactobacter sp.]|uniref:dTMP kinase n=1 Tax=Galactobacter sp. TaxID=2676125 RepID=UPI0025C5443C|nr:dTMP kinase [Galactobacter sp.]
MNTEHPSPATPDSRPGVFLVFEGGDGSGKSTQTRRVAEALEEQGLEVVLTREPGGTPIAEELRSLVLDPANAPVDDRTEALLYATARSSHVHRVILPALQRGAVVVCDRFVDSSLAYQGVGRGLGIDTVARLNAFGTEGLLPDLTVVLDAPAELGRIRRGERSETEDRLEAEPDSFHSTVRSTFLELAAQAPERYLVLDATRSAADLTAAVLHALEPLLTSADGAVTTEAGEPAVGHKNAEERA